MKICKHLLLLSATLLMLTFNSNGQAFVDDIRVGQRMPSKIDMGGYKEETAQNCSCRTFSIKHQDGGSVQGEVVAIHYDKKETVIGVITIKMRSSSLDAQKVYTFRLSDYMKTQNVFKDRQLIKVRDSDNGVVDGIYYFIYSFDNGEIYRGTGVVKNTIIEETYFPKSSYEPKLMN